VYRRSGEEFATGERVDYERGSMSAAWRSLKRKGSILIGSFILVALFGCGGSPKPAESSTPSVTTRADAPAKSAAGDSDNNDEASATPAPVRATCDDGTCTACGDALCPNGWYCDESAPGGPACGWLPECAQKASCACVKKSFSGCACDEHLGAAHLSCG
jgi:hypothetical protein